jgi:hypothetical protein
MAGWRLTFGALRERRMEEDCHSDTAGCGGMVEGDGGMHGSDVPMTRGVTMVISICPAILASGVHAEEGKPAWP